MIQRGAAREKMKEREREREGERRGEVNRVEQLSIKIFQPRRITVF